MSHQKLPEHSIGDGTSEVVIALVLVPIGPQGLRGGGGGGV